MAQFRQGLGDCTNKPASLARKTDRFRVFGIILMFLTGEVR